MLLLYILLVIAYCWTLDRLCEVIGRRRFRERVRELRSQVRATLLARGKHHV